MRVGMVLVVRPNVHHIYIFIIYLPRSLYIFLLRTRSVGYQPIFHTLYFALHYAHVLNNVVLTTVIEMVEVPKYWM